MKRKHTATKAIRLSMGGSLVSTGRKMRGRLYRAIRKSQGAAKRAGRDLGGAAALPHFRPGILFLFLALRTRPESAATLRMLWQRKLPRVDAHVRGRSRDHDRVESPIRA